MRLYTKQDLQKALKDVGLTDGDTVYLQSQLFSMGRPSGVRTRDDFCNFFIQAVREIIGNSGTLVVPTMSTQVGRSDEIYDPDTTPSNYGTLPEFVALNPDFIRSRHPLISLAAQGPLAEEICGLKSTHNFNIFSPFEKMVRCGAKNIFVGVKLSKAAQIIHYSEFVFGVPYFYNKILTKRPRISGFSSSHLTSAAVRYLHVDATQDLRAVEDVLLESGVCQTATVGDGSIIGASMADMVDVVVNQLERDPFFLLKQTVVFPFGEPPVDGDQHFFKMPIPDSRLSEQTREVTIFHMASQHSPTFAEALLAQMRSASDFLNLKHLVSLSATSMREFAWSWMKCHENDDVDGKSQVVKIFGSPEAWQAHNFALGYFYAPFADTRCKSASIGISTVFAEALSRRFSYSKRFKEHKAVSDACHLEDNLASFSDIHFNAINIEKPSLTYVANICCSVLVEGGVALVEMNLLSTLKSEETSRTLEKDFTTKLQKVGLLIERIYLHESRNAFSLILRKLQTAE